MASWFCPVAYSRLASPSLEVTASGSSRRLAPFFSAFFLQAGSGEQAVGAGVLIQADGGRSIAHGRSPSPRTSGAARVGSCLLSVPRASLSTRHAACPPHRPPPPPPFPPWISHTYLHRSRARFFFRFFTGCSPICSARASLQMSVTVAPNTPPPPPRRLPPAAPARPLGPALSPPGSPPSSSPSSSSPSSPSPSCSAKEDQQASVPTLCVLPPRHLRHRSLSAQPPGCPPVLRRRGAAAGCDACAVLATHRAALQPPPAAERMKDSRSCAGCWTKNERKCAGRCSEGTEVVRGGQAQSVRPRHASRPNTLACGASRRCAHRRPPAPACPPASSSGRRPPQNSRGPPHRRPPQLCWGREIEGCKELSKVPASQDGRGPPHRRPPQLQQWWRQD